MRGTDEVTAVSIVFVVVAVVLTGQPALLGFLLVPALLIALGRWRVTVDHTGLWARRLLGAPRTGVALGEVVRADVVPLHPLREFGRGGSAQTSKAAMGSCCARETRLPCSVQAVEYLWPPWMAQMTAWPCSMVWPTGRVPRERGYGDERGL